MHSNAFAVAAIGAMATAACIVEPGALQSQQPRDGEREHERVSAERGDAPAGGGPARDTRQGGPAPSPRTYEDGQGTKVEFELGEHAFATRLVSYEMGDPPVRAESNKEPRVILGPPDQGFEDKTTISLGCGGRITVAFDHYALIDGPGPDLHLFEVGAQIEAMLVEISRDGQRWHRVGVVSGQPASVDIADVAEPGVRYPYVRITDQKDYCSGRYAGADLKAVGLINAR